MRRPSSCLGVGAAVLALAATLAPVASAQDLWDNPAYPNQVMGEISYTAATFAARDWAPCQGATLNIAYNQALFSVIGTTFGGDGRTTFALPTYPPLQAQGQGQVLPKICVWGTYPQHDVASGTPVTGLMRLIMPNWYWDMRPCDGSPIRKQDRPALFAMLTPGGGAAAPPEATAALPQLGFKYDDQPKWYIDARAGSQLVGYLADVRRWPATAAVPDGWRPCDGALLPIQENQALFALLEFRFGGDGRRTFALPALPDQGGTRWIICMQGIFPSQF